MKNSDALTTNSGRPARQLAAPTMSAVVQERYGSAETLHVRTIARPRIREHEVLIRVVAAGVDRGTWHKMTGRPFVIRVTGFGLRAPRNLVPGTKLSGIVEQVGHAVTGFRVGDEVYGTGIGAFAEYARASESQLACKPPELRFEHAPAVAFGGVTALQALRDHGRLQGGQHVLVVGASGGVGSFAVQLAKAGGAEVTGVCSSAKTDFVRSLGADHVIDYTRREFTEEPQRFDLILDIAGDRRVARLRRALTPRGTLVIVGGEHGGRLTGGLQRQLFARAQSAFTTQKLGSMFTRETSVDLEVLNGLIAGGMITPAIEQTYPLGRAADAVGMLESGRVLGSIVIAM
jgi:NADPH:quinone reductase-like Zn-dependent oxidoreductase